MASPIKKLGLYKRTLPHHKRSQLMWRLRFIWRKHVVGRRAPMPRQAPAWNAEALERVEDFAREYADHLEVPPRFLRVLQDNELILLNYPVGIAEGIPWHDKVASKLWRYNLHYLEWCRWVALAPDLEGESLERERVQGWLLDWQAKNPVSNDIAWDPFVVTQRLLNWSLLQSLYRFDDEILGRSFVQQAQYLSRNLERDVLANHLLKNLAALVVAGSLLDHHMRDEALNLLEAELAEQILNDGGHYERSPMYQLQLLEDLLLVHAALPSPPVFLVETLKKMADFAAQLRHPDGDIPLFNDAARDPARPADKLYALARQRLGIAAPKVATHNFAMENSGFYVMSAGNAKSRMIVRAGEHGPDYQLGHAHSDLLSYELSMDGKRLVVDSGVQGYSDDPFRDYTRSTRAHNTVSVNGQEQLEAWGVFRVGRRSKSKTLAFESTSYGQYFYGEHDAFAPYTHRRRIHCDKLGLCFVLDEIEGPGKIEAESYIHLHPLWSITHRRGYYSIRITETLYRIFPIGVREGNLYRGQKEPFQQGWYCPELGKSQQNWCLTLRAGGESKLRFGYAIVPASGNIKSNYDLSMYVAMLDQEHGFDSWYKNSEEEAPEEAGADEE